MTNSITNSNTSKPENRFSNSLGHDYDTFGQIVHYYAQEQQTIARTVNATIVEDMPLLEIDCGSGLTTRALFAAMLPNRNYQIISIDSEPNMVAQIRENLADRIANGQLVVIEADAVRYMQSQPANSLRNVVTAFALHNLTAPQRRSIHQAIYRVLQPGGYFHNYDKIANNDTAAHYESYNASLGRIMAGYTTRGDIIKAQEWYNHFVEDNKPERIEIESVVKKELHDIGFAQVDITDRIEMDALITARKIS